MEDTVGARMDFEIVSIRQEVTLDIVLRYLRRLKKLPDHTDQVFVIDREERLMGTLPVDRILTHYPEDAVKDVMLTVLRQSVHPFSSVLRNNVRQTFLQIQR